MGFFENNQTKSLSRPDGKIQSCASCGRYQGAQSPKMEFQGNGKKKILNIGPSPNQVNDENNTFWMDRNGRTLERRLKEIGIDIHEDCWNINAVNCYSEMDCSDYEIECCRRIVNKTISQLKPNIIILYGEEALYSVIGNKWKKDMGTLTKWRGFTIPDREIGAWIIPVFDPKWVADHPYPEIEKVWEKDFQEIKNILDTPFPKWEDEKKYINYVHQSEISKTIQMIEKKYDGGMLFFDYETTGLKPHKKGHRIVCTSLCPDPKECFVFMGPNTKQDKAALGNLLKNCNIRKGAANMKFEWAWTLERIWVEPGPFVWDTMQAAHVLDNRAKITGLKFQTYINFGVSSYDELVSPYLTTKKEGEDDKSANSINKIFEFIQKYGEKELLTYCGLDAIYEHKLALVQMEKLGFTP